MWVGQRLEGKTGQRPEFSDVCLLALGTARAAASLGDGEMAQWLRALTIKSDTQSPISRSHRV